MPSTDVATLIDRCLDRHQGELSLYIDDMPISLRRRPGGWYYIAELQLPFPVDIKVMQCALRLTRPALMNFADKSAALCLDPQSESLCLILRLNNDQTDYAVTLLESLCSQCEVWQETLLSLLTRQRVTSSV